MQLKIQTKTKVKILSILLASILAISAVAWFFGRYQLLFRSPITVGIHSPMTVVRRTEVINITQVVEKKDGNQNPLTPDQQFACNLFGKDCVTALAIMRAESHDRHDAIHINANGSADLGCFQVNTIHLAKIDTSKLNLLNCQDNARAAFAIYQQQKGFGAWVTFTSGEYKKYLIN